MHSHEAGEEEKAISQERSEAMSPRRRTPVVIGVVEKIKEAVNSLLRNDQPSNTQLPLIQLILQYQTCQSPPLMPIRLKPHHHMTFRSPPMRMKVINTL
ncbi:hypothetical protein I3760_14G068200 [Carya illinoinensis]|nr:hypothetical protein I3760_14G068200 [Carya illinoinensis]